MSRPVIGVIANVQKVENRNAHLVGERYLRAVAEVAGALPVTFAACPELTAVGDLLETVDAILLTGGRSNVHPSRFGVAADPRHEPYDPRRDAVALDLVQACVSLGMPIFGVCRGLQEINVSFGGTLHPEIRELPGRMNHRMPRLANGEMHPDPATVFADRHDVRLVPGGTFARLFGAETVRVNSLHGQGIQDLGSRIVVEGVAEDGTIEAIRVADAPGFALGVQWHAEYEAPTNHVNRTLFEAFGKAALNHRRRRAAV